MHHSSIFIQYHISGKSNCRYYLQLPGRRFPHVAAVVLDNTDRCCCTKTRCRYRRAGTCRSSPHSPVRCYRMERLILLIKSSNSSRKLFAIPLLSPTVPNLLIRVSMSCESVYHNLSDRTVDLLHPFSILASIWTYWLNQHRCSSGLPLQYPHSQGPHNRRYRRFSSTDFLSATPSGCHSRHDPVGYSGARHPITCGAV